MGSLNAQLGQLTDKVDHWLTADQKHRWVASALLLIEPHLRRVGYYLNLNWPHGLWLGQWSTRERREFNRQFSTEEAYWGYLVKLR